MWSFFWSRPLVNGDLFFLSNRYPLLNAMISFTDSNSKIRTFLGMALLLTATVTAFFPALSGNFLWDDDYHVTNNACVAGPLGFREIWTTTQSNFFPLVLSTWRLEFLAWGASPLPFHITNLLFHAAAAMILWQILRELGVRGALLGALIWCLHPVQAESVCWISEQKNTESAFFYLSSLLFGIRWMRSGKLFAPNWWGALLLAFMAFSSKTSTIMLPAILIICWWWCGLPWSRRRLSMLLPFFLLSAVAGLLTMLEQKYHVGAVGSLYNLGLSERITLAGLIPWFYLWKLLLPYDVNFIYPRWTPGDLLLPGLVGVMAILTLIALLAMKARRSSAAAATLFAFVCFLVGLFPVLGLFDAYFFRYSYVSDHFQYLASMAPAALAGAALSSLPSRGIYPRLSMAIRSLAPVILLVFVLLDWRGSLRFRDSETLWKETLRLNPLSGIANHNLATELLYLGRTSEAIEEFLKILSRTPGDAGALNNLGVIKLKSGDPKGARHFFEEVLKSAPNEPATLCNLGETLILTGDHTAAESYLRQSVDLNGNSHAATMLSILLREKGDVDASLRIGQAAIGSNPLDPQAWLAVGLSQRDIGDLPSAILSLRTGVKLAPEDGQLVNTLFTMLLDSGKEIEGQELLERRLLSHRDDPDTILNLALLRMRQTRNDEALSLLQELVLSDPSHARAHDLQADVLRKMKRNEEAALELQRALAIEGSNPRLLLNLAAIQAELGMRDLALQTATKGLKEAQSQGEREICHHLLQLIRSLKR